MHSKPVLGREEVARVLGAAREEAQRQGWAVSIAVVDDGGHPLALERLDGCAPIGAYIATEKARSAALGRRETKRYEDMINGGRSAFLSVPLLQATLEGGVPILVDVCYRLPALNRGNPPEVNNEEVAMRGVWTDL